MPQKPTKPKGWINPRDTRDEEFAPPSFYYPQGTPSVDTCSKTESKQVPGDSRIPLDTTGIPLPPSTCNQRTTATDTKNTTLDIPLPPTEISEPCQTTAVLHNIDIVIKSLRNQT